MFDFCDIKIQPFSVFFIIFGQLRNENYTVTDSINRVIESKLGCCKFHILRSCIDRIFTVSRQYRIE